MFKKKPSIKTLSPLRSSDRRKTADKIITDYKIELSGEQDDTPEGKAAAAAAHTALRNALLPDNALSAKFTTTSGPNLKEVSGTVYVGNYAAGEQRVLWFSIDGQLYPTVYTLWKNAGILPLLHTPSMVIDKIKGGADLMTPGLAGPPFPTGAKLGAVVAIAAYENPSVPLAVGVCAIDISTLKSARGAKGHAVDMMHWSGDEVWEWSTSGKTGLAPPETLEGWVDEGKNDLAKNTQDLDLDEDEQPEDGGVALPLTDLEDKPKINHNPYISGEDIAEVVDMEDEKDMTTDEIDETFRQAFLYGVYHHLGMHSDQPKHGLTFPLTQSIVMSTLVLPFLPTFTPKQSDSLVIKKTSWKNARKFIKALDKQKLLLSKDRPGNEVDVLDIDFNDTAFSDFQPYKLPKKEATGGQQNKSNTGTTDTSDDSIGQNLKRLELYRPKEILAPLFKSSETISPHQPYHTPTTLRTALSTYLTTHTLHHPTNKRLATLDPFLANTLFNPAQNPLDAELLARGTAPRDTLSDRILALCQPYHSISRLSSTATTPSDAAAEAKPRPGPAPPITLTLETRSGNKTVTRVSGFEVYFIRPQPLAEELRKVCASSTSVEAVSRHGKLGSEVMVQGPQREAVLKALERRGVDGRWVEVLDRVKKGKK